jgi:hypothetical protein
MTKKVWIAWSSQAMTKEKCLKMCLESPGVTKDYWIPVFTGMTKDQGHTRFKGQE